MPVATHPNTLDAPPTAALNPDDILPGEEPYKRSFVGLFVEFDLRRQGGKVSREKGEVIAQRWLGFTRRGAIPEYEVTIRGRQSGRSALARVTRDFVRPI